MKSADGPAAESSENGGRAPSVWSPLLQAHEFFRGGPVSAEGWSQLVAKGRDWESLYRERWQHDKVVRSTHGVNCTGSCMLYAIWPFSRLVHAWSYPLQYLGRPYILYRRRYPPAHPLRPEARPRDTAPPTAERRS